MAGIECPDKGRRGFEKLGQWAEWGLGGYWVKWLIFIILGVFCGLR